MDKVGKVLPGVLARQPNQRQIAELRIRMALLEILGGELAAGCQEIALRGSTLTLGTSNPALAHQLRLDAAAILERLNSRGLPRRVRILRVLTGRPAARP